MLLMIIKMMSIALLYTALTVLLWKYLQNKTFGYPQRLLVAVIYGICAILSTHFGVDYKDMMVNVRDLGPLSAGLFFDPLAGIIAGLIGGIERFIAGEYWGVGSFTRIACATSTCLAGFVAAGIHIFIFKRKKPSAGYAFFMGAIMEVFHMYVIFITHRSDMKKAFYVVRYCAPPMIFFCALGLAISSVALQLYSGEWVNPFKAVHNKEVSLSHRFSTRLFLVTAGVLILTLAFSYGLQTETANQKSRAELKDISEDISNTYMSLQDTEATGIPQIRETARLEARAFAATINEMGGGVDNLNDSFLENIRKIFGLTSINIISEDGIVLKSAGDPTVYTDLVLQLSSGLLDSAVFDSSPSDVAAAALCGNSIVQVTISKDSFSSALNLSELDVALTYFHVGNGGSFDIYRSDGSIIAGDHIGTTLSEMDFRLLKSQSPETFFTASVFGEESLCYLTELDDDATLGVRLPVSEIYADRDSQTYETALAYITLFSFIYILISMLVESIVTNNIRVVNDSLSRFTNENITESEFVRESSSFASLANNINQTVDVLKGYIDAAEKRMELEIQFARTLQDTSVPKSFFFSRKDVELFATVEPCKDVGCDFYDYFFVGQNHLTMVIADVSGSGVPASMFMMKAKAAIRGFAESGMSPADIMFNANNMLFEGNEDGTTVTAWIGIIDLKNGEMKCANAGHVSPIIMRAGDNYELYEDNPGPHLASGENLTFEGYEFMFNPGDRIFIYTDGISEATDENGHKYTAGRLVDLLNEIARHSPMEEVIANVKLDVAAFVGMDGQNDDIAMLGFAYKDRE